jgi:hypothetical protein
MAHVAAILLAMVPKDMPGKKYFQYQIPVRASLATNSPYPSKPPAIPMVYEYRGCRAMMGYFLIVSYYP